MTTLLKQLEGMLPEEKDIESLESGHMVNGYNQAIADVRKVLGGVRIDWQLADSIAKAICQK